MDPQAKISVVVPVYNEHDSIATCLLRLDAALAGEAHEILVCYDFDEDTTLSAIAAMKDRPASVRLVKNTIGRGAANALRAGFAAAQGDVVVTSMADLSDPPEIVPRMAALMRREKLAVVSGSRYMPGGSQSGGPLLKRTLSHAAGVSLDWIAGIGTKDATNNFRAYSKEYLDSVTIESRAGFEIALELTVKAHLSGRRVGEIPSSWVDRSAGKSRFRLWKWLPSYLGWWLRAAWQPLVVWAAFALCLALGGLHPPGNRDLAPTLRYAILACALPALGAVLLARRLRGRTTLVDALHPLAWIHPWQLELLLAGRGAIALGSSLAISAVILGTTTGWRRAASACAELARRVFRQEVLGLALLSILLWLAHVAIPRGTSVGEVDSSWAQGIAYAFENGLQEGIDWLFTAGPLGVMHNAIYSRHLFWTEVIVWECGVKLAMAVLLTVTMLRFRGVLERVLYYALLVIAPMDKDAYAFLAVLAATVWILDRPTLGRPVVWFGIALFAVLALVKFTVFALCVACVMLIAIAVWRASSLRRAFAFVALWLVGQTAAWMLSGQALSTVPAYLVGAIETSAGYNEAMSRVPLERDLIVAYVAGVGLALVVLGHVFGKRPRSIARWAAAGALVAGFFVTYKAGYTRGEDHDSIFFTFAGAAPFLLGDVAGAGVLARVACVSGRLVCAGSVLCGLILSMGMNAYAVRDLATGALGSATDNLLLLRDLRGCIRDNEAEREQHRRDFDLARVRATVGDATIDSVSYEAGLVILEDLHWKPRLTVQGYSAYTPSLLEGNADCLRGDRAPKYVLFNPDTVDSRLPMMDDGEVLQVLARDYEPLFVEHGRLLMRHAPRPEPPRPPEILMERTIRFGETVDIGAFGGECQLLALDIRYTASGRIRKMLDRAPPLFIDIRTSHDDTARFRIIPGMMKSGVILNPLMGNLDQWMRWMVREPLPWIASFRLVSPRSPSMYEPEVHLRLMRADDLVPARAPHLRQYLATAPGEIVLTPSAEIVSTLPPAIHPPPVTIDSDEPLRTLETPTQLVTVVHAPSRIEIRVAAGHHRMKGEFGFAPAARNPGCSPGARVQIALAGLAGSDKSRTLYERTLDSTNADDMFRGVPFEFEFDAETAGSLWLSTESTSRGGDSRCAWTYWKHVRIDE